MRPHVVILGAGIIGAAIARELAGRGHPVTLLERDPQPGRRASWAAAGILTPMHLADYPEPLARICVESACMYPEWVQAVQRETGIDVEYRVTGAIFVGTDRCALPHEVLEGKALRTVEPALASSITRALRAPEAAQVRNHRLTRALLAAASRRGAGIRTSCGDLVDVLREGDRFTGVRTTAGTFLGDLAVLAAGAWSGQIAPRFSLDLPVRPVRGQIVLLKGQPDAVRHVIIADGHYLVPRADGHLLAGTTTEEAGFDERTTAQAVETLLRRARELVPAAAQMSVERAWAGLRPATPDRLPRVQFASGWRNVLVACGHYRNGILLAPWTAARIAELIGSGAA